MGKLKADDVIRRKGIVVGMFRNFYRGTRNPEGGAEHPLGKNTQGMRSAFEINVTPRLKVNVSDGRIIAWLKCAGTSSQTDAGKTYLFVARTFLFRICLLDRHHLDEF
jgi:hypothetical protein